MLFLLWHLYKVMIYTPIGWITLPLCDLNKCQPPPAFTFTSYSIARQGKTNIVIYNVKFWKNEADCAVNSGFMFSGYGCRLLVTSIPENNSPVFK